MLEHIAFIGLSAHAPTALATFWRNAAGYGTARAGDAWVVDAPRCPLRITQALGPAVRQPVNVPGITHVCVQMRDLAARHASFEAAGARPHCAPLDLGTGNRYSYVRDPEQNVIEIEGVPSEADAPLPWIAHVGIATQQLAHMRSFYSKLLGVSASEPHRVGPNPRLDALSDLPGVCADMVWLKGRNITVELIQFEIPVTDAVRTHDAPGYHRIAFANAGKHMRDIVLIGARPVADDCVADPDGNLLQLL